jgi:DNA-binding CsgD family transcriptional regulator
LSCSPRSATTTTAIPRAPPAELLDGIRRRRWGDSPFRPDVLRRLVRRAADSRVAPRALDGLDLTERERDVLDPVAEGMSNAEIGERRHIGVTTVKTHVTALMAKTGAPNRSRWSPKPMRPMRVIQGGGDLGAYLRQVAGQGSPVKGRRSR